MRRYIYHLLIRVGATIIKMTHLTYWHRYLSGAPFCNIAHVITAHHVLLSILDVVDFRSYVDEYM